LLAQRAPAEVMMKKQVGYLMVGLLVGCGAPGGVDGGEVEEQAAVGKADSSLLKVGTYTDSGKSDYTKLALVAFHRFHAECAQASPACNGATLVQGTYRLTAKAGTKFLILSTDGKEFRRLTYKIEDSFRVSFTSDHDFEMESSFFDPGFCFDTADCALVSGLVYTCQASACVDLCMPAVEAAAIDLYGGQAAFDKDGGEFSAGTASNNQNLYEGEILTDDRFHTTFTVTVDRSGPQCKVVKSELGEGFF
jgi:hypothetical protein